MVGVKVVLLNFLPSLKTALYINFKKLAPPLILGWLRPCSKWSKLEIAIIELFTLNNIEADYDLQNRGEFLLFK